VTVSVLARGLKDIERYFEQLPEVAEKSIVLAINDVSSKKGMTLIRKTMRAQISFPKGYLEKGRLAVFRKAYKGRPEATIRGRDRATSLARFALPGQAPGQKRKFGTRVQVQPGAVRNMKRSFLIKLKNNNVGLAMRFPAGQAPEKSQAAVPLGTSGLWLFYGPSVEQVFRDVAEEVKPAIGDMIEAEFYRQFARMARYG